MNREGCIYIGKGMKKVTSRERAEVLKIGRGTYNSGQGVRKRLHTEQRQNYHQQEGLTVT